MPVEAVLIAEIDPRTLVHLPQALSDSLPHLRIDICDSLDGLTRKVRDTSYDTIAINPLLIQDYPRIKQKKPFQLLTPLLVTADSEQRPLAQAALEREAFDLIVKPIVPSEAAHTVRLALWQNRLLQLLVSKDRAVSRFQEHMAAFPHARQAEEQFMSKMAAYERSFEALRSSMRLLLNVEDEQALFDMAVAVADITRQRALDRLTTLSEGDPSR